MASLKDFRVRIASVKATRKITRAMQMVAAAKLKRAQEAAEQARPYAERMAASIARLSAAAGSAHSGPALLTGSGDDKRHILVVATADRGLCGGFNGNIVKRARAEIRRLEDAGKRVALITAGRKGKMSLLRGHGALMQTHFDLRAAGAQAIAQHIGDDLIARFEAGECDICSVIFSEYGGVLRQTPVVRRLIPVMAQEDGAAGTAEHHICEPSEAEVLRVLAPLQVKAQILAALLENAAGEQGARMNAMDNATRNASDMIRDLELRYNRARQARITRELIEIISGAEAL